MTDFQIEALVLVFGGSAALIGAIICRDFRWPGLCLMGSGLFVMVFEPLIAMMLAS